MSDSFTKGLATRKQVMGDDFVARAFDNLDELSQPLQQWVTEHAWGSTWQRTDELDLRTRSLVTCAMLAALGHSQELKGHVRGALNNGATWQEIREVLLHAAVYAGAPRALEALRCAREVFEQQGITIPKVSS